MIIDERLPTTKVPKNKLLSWYMTCIQRYRTLTHSIVAMPTPNQKANQPNGKTTHPTLQGVELPPPALRTCSSSRLVCKPSVSPGGKSNIAPPQTQQVWTSEWRGMRGCTRQRYASKCGVDFAIPAARSCNRMASRTPPRSSRRSLICPIPSLELRTWVRQISRGSVLISWD